MSTESDWKAMMAKREEKHRKALRKPDVVKEELLKLLTFDKLRKQLSESEIAEHELSMVIHRVRKIVRNG